MKSDLLYLIQMVCVASARVTLGLKTNDEFSAECHAMINDFIQKHDKPSLWKRVFG